MHIRPEIASIASEMTAWRRDLHAHPEIGFEEVRTSGMVAGLLASWGVEVHGGLGRTGVVGVLRGRPGNRAIGLRADMDALPMQEANGFAHTSEIPGRMHACGHDGHTAMLLGAAKCLAQSRDFAGTVNFFFQPAEEMLAGAKAMIDDGLFGRFPCDAVYAIHNDPTTEFGLVNVRAGGMLCAADHFVLRIRGKGSHGGMPHEGIDPIAVAGHVVCVLQTIIGRHINPVDMAAISIGQIHGGTYDNVIPEVVELRGTTRTLSPKVRDRLELLFRRAVESTVAAQGATVEIDYRQCCPPTINTPAEAEFARAAAAKVVGSDRILGAEPSWTAGEDFAFMLAGIPGAYAFFGQRGADQTAIPLHNPNYDFNDDLLPVGASYFVTLVEDALE